MPKINITDWLLRIVSRIIVVICTLLDASFSCPHSTMLVSWGTLCSQYRDTRRLVTQVHWGTVTWQINVTLVICVLERRLGYTQYGILERCYSFSLLTLGLWSPGLRLGFVALAAACVRARLSTITATSRLREEEKYYYTSNDIAGYIQQFIKPCSWCIFDMTNLETLLPSWLGLFATHLMKMKVSNIMKRTR